MTIARRELEQLCHDIARPIRSTRRDASFGVTRGSAESGPVLARRPQGVNAGFNGWGNRRVSRGLFREVAQLRERREGAVDVDVFGLRFEDHYEGGAAVQFLSVNDRPSCLPSCLAMLYILRNKISCSKLRSRMQVL